MTDVPASVVSSRQKGRETPPLHVLATNTNTIRRYENRAFRPRLRTEMVVLSAY